MKCIMYLTVAILLTGLTVQAQDRFFPQSQKIGKQVITTIDRVSPPAALLPEPKALAALVALNLQAPAGAPPAKAVPPAVVPGPKAPPAEGAPKVLEGPYALPVVLDARDWRCGRCFTDECNRRWLLVCGPAPCTNPPLISGWILRTTDQRLFFFTTSGTLFLHVVPPAIGMPVP